MIGEAMATNTPCVVTDVGDSKWIVDKTGVVVAPGNPEALKKAIDALLAHLNFSGNQDQRIRHRVVSNFSITKMVLATEAALLRILQRP